MLANKVLAASIAILLLSSVVAISAPIRIQAQDNGNNNNNGENGEDEKLSLSISVADKLVRGNKQTIHAVTNEPGAHIWGYVMYASGSVPRIITGETDNQGYFDYQWKVGARSAPGVFTVRLLAIDGNDFNDIATASATFTVTGKHPPQVTPTPTPEPTPVPVPIENITEPVPVDNGTSIVVENGTIVCIQAPCPGNVTETPIDPQNDTQVVIVPENETVVVTPDNGTDISIPINETDIVIPTNETIEPEPTTNETEVVIAPLNETAVITPENATDFEEIPDEVISEINDTAIVVPSNETVVAENETAVIDQNETSVFPDPFPITNETAPIEEEIVVAPVNETTVVTPENATDISIPVNETSVVIPSNETEVPQATTNETEVIIAPANETEVVTPENVTLVEEIPDEVISAINETSVVAPVDETVIAENITVIGNATDPEPDAVEGNVTAGNGTDIIPIEAIPITNETIPGPIEEVIANVTEEVEQAVIDVEQNDPTAQEQLNVAIVNSINAVSNLLEETVPGMTEEDVQNIQLEDLNNALEKALIASSS